MNRYLPLEELRSFSRRVSQEGIVMLENKNDILPLINRKVALFGRIQTNYYKSGTGSGGMVNVTDVPSFLDAFLENPRIDLNEKVMNHYLNWSNDNPFDAGTGKWASEPWSQVEMEITKEEIKNLKRNLETPVVIIGRTAGEDRDNFLGKGSYLLTDTEYLLIKNVKAVYGSVIVVLNVGNIICNNFVKELDVDGLIYAWHAGQDGARATVDVLTGYINPSAKLPDTIVKDLTKYPANNSFGDLKKVYYEEDIYVGYRFFETFMPEEVIYPFGFGLSYTNFSLSLIESKFNGHEISLKINVKNINNYPGKETVQVYAAKPQGLLGKPKIELIAFAKTKTLYENESQEISFTINLDKLASYDDAGLVEKSSYVLELGEYNIYFGSSSRDLNIGLSFYLENNIVTKILSEQMAPVEKFLRLKPKLENNKLVQTYENVKLRETNYTDKILKDIKEPLTYKKEASKLIDVYNKKISIDEFIRTLSYEDLSKIVLGEGMSSPKVTPGTASAFGGVTNSLLEKGIPVICCADGPSGIRMDSGALATSMPNGTLLASTFNKQIVEDLYELEAMEMLNYDIDIILGPGINIHRHPLNGRNFEYFSEDPLLTGVMAAAVIRGLNNKGVTGAMKHFTANNQESARTEVDSIVSERALREIYLKGYEIAIKESKASVIMTSYNPINSVWAASNYELNTKILRDEWGFKGIVMTDWWAKMNDFGEIGTSLNLKALVRAQNDLYMVTPDALLHQSNLDESYQDGSITLYELQRNARNILEFIMLTPKFKRENNLLIDNLGRQIDPWFKSDELKPRYSFILDNELKPQVTSFSNQINLNNLNSKYVIEQKNDITTVLINDNEQTLYNFGIKTVSVVNDVYELTKLITDEKSLFLPNHNEIIKIDLENYNLKNDIANKTWKDIKKDSIYSYQINNETTSKFRISFDISSTQTKITQMPFSVYLDYKNEQTLIPNGTDGKIITVYCDINITNINKFISFKFNKTGLDIYDIKIERLK